jgi:cardiolipin synthase A/B
MKDSEKENYTLFDLPPALHDAMIADIEKARDYIFLETYKFGNDSVGRTFRDALTLKAKEGIKIKLLIDSWGAGVGLSFFNEMISHGAEVRFFKKIVLAFDFFTKNHRRNHRKLLLIDDKITYIGSANIAGHSINWRELQLRIEGKITKHFKNTFLASAKLYRKYILNKFNYRKTINHCGFEIIQDMPSIYRQRIKKRYETLIGKARSEIVIETPYFIPGFKLRKKLMEAAARGIDVKIIMPEHSDVRIVDLLRNKYLGQMHRNKVNILFYTPANLHAKAALFDNEIFGIGTTNFDYRSFRYMFEIMLFGRNKTIVTSLRKHMDETIKDCIPFDYDAWLNRPVIEKIISQLLVPFRHLF